MFNSFYGYLLKVKGKHCYATAEIHISFFRSNFLIRRANNEKNATLNYSFCRQNYLAFYFYSLGAVQKIICDMHTSSVEFTFILPAAFLYESIFCIYSIHTVWVSNLWREEIGAKAACKMFMVLTPGRGFRNVSPSVTSEMNPFIIFTLQDSFSA